MGVNRSLPNQLEMQSEGAWEVTVVAPDQFIGKNDIRPAVYERDAADVADICVVPAKLTNSFQFFFYQKNLRRFIKEGQFDLVHAWEEPYVLAGWQIARAARDLAPVVYRTAQSLPKRYPPPFSEIERYCVKSMKGWIFSGRLVEENLLKRPGYDERPRLYAPLGFDESRFRRDRGEGDRVREELGWGRDRPVVGYLGRLVEAKGLRVLMSAFDRRKEWSLLIVGDGNMKSEIAAWASQHADRVRICDNVKHEEVGRYLNAMDVLACPSLTTPQWKEQFGRMIVEGFACGVPVVGSSSGEIPTVIGDTGIVTQEGDAEDLARSLSNVLSDPKLKQELGEAGYRRAMENFTWASIARNTLGFFDKLIA